MAIYFSKLIEWNASIVDDGSKNMANSNVIERNRRNGGRSPKSLYLIINNRVNPVLEVSVSYWNPCNHSI